MVTPDFVSCRVLRHEQLAPAVIRTTFHSQAIAERALPGQFAMVHCGSRGSHDPLLPRPFSFNRIDREAHTFSLLYRLVGRGTEFLARQPLGREVPLLAPLGQGFKLPTTPAPTLLIAGGMGIAPLFPLALALRELGCRVKLLYGAREAQQLVDTEAFDEIGVTRAICAEDSCSPGETLVTDLLAQELDSGTPYALALACGPKAMLAATKQLCANRQLPLQLSLEEHMACGLGVCLGCTCQRGDASGYWHICTDGPVLWAEEVAI